MATYYVNIAPTGLDWELHEGAPDGPVTNATADADVLAALRAAGHEVVTRLDTRRLDWIVRADRVPAIEAAAAEINAKAAKRGTGFAELHFGDAFVSERVVDEITGRKVKRMVRRMTGWVQVPRIAGFRLVAVLDHTLTEGNVVASVDRSFPLPHEYRTAAPVCEHCELNRKRVTTVVLQEVTSGALKQIGKSCLKAYTGSDGLGALFLLSALDDFERTACDDGDDGDWVPGPGLGWIDLAAFLPVAAAVIRLDGWVSKVTSEDTGKPSTGHTADMAFTGLRGAKAADWKAYEPTDADRELAEAAMAWAAALPDGCGDYEHNLRTVIRAGVVPPRRLTLAASGVQAYRRHLGLTARAQAEAAAPKTPKAHVGKVGDRLDLTVTLVAEPRVFDGTYGATTLYKFADANGNGLTTFASRPLYLGPRELAPGDKCKIRGTVKAHKDFRGEPETALTRVAVVG